MDVEDNWRKSTYSSSNGGNCVEVNTSYPGGMIGVRDTKQHGEGPVLQFTPDEWRAFLAGAQEGEFDL